MKLSWERIQAIFFNVLTELCSTANQKRYNKNLEKPVNNSTVQSDTFDLMFDHVYIERFAFNSIYTFIRFLTFEPNWKTEIYENWMISDQK